jgi:hypothetical protein
LGGEKNSLLSGQLVLQKSPTRDNTYDVTIQRQQGGNGSTITDENPAGHN